MPPLPRDDNQQPNNDDSFTIPRFPRGQIDELARMFGDNPLPEHKTPQTPAPTPTGQTFTPITGTAWHHANGHILWNGPQWPEWATPTKPGDTTIHALIDHYDIKGSRRPKVPANVEQLNADIARLQDRTGIYTLTLSAPPDQLTAHDIPALVRRILPLIPNDILGTSDNSAEINVDVSPYGGRSPSITIERDGRQFLATVRFDKQAIGFLRVFTNTHPNRVTENHWNGTLDQLDKIFATRSTEPHAHADDNDNDDDLDAIEKAARQSLHGEKAIPNTSRARSAPVDHELVAEYAIRLKALWKAASGLNIPQIEMLTRMASRMG